VTRNVLFGTLGTIEVLIAALLPPTRAFANTTPQAEVHVVLLGQACLLQGPLDEATLRLIHSIGPAQLYPQTSDLTSPEFEKQLKLGLEKIKSATLPSAFDRYREKAIQRFNLQIEFISQYRKTPKGLLSLAKKYLKQDELKSIETRIKKGTDAQSDLQSALATEIFEEATQKLDPEPDYHRANKRLDVKYTCSFEEENMAEEE
jgi:hypothetical protein